jgi:phospholipase C
VANPSFVIVLMFENRSFDHVVGFLPGVGDLTGEETNPVDPTDPNSARVPVSRSDGTGSERALCPGHQFSDVQLQLFGGPNVVDPAPLNGFVASALAQPRVTPDLARKVMVCQTPQTVPVLSRLAREYCTCTRWFSSVPGPTWPNRYFVHAATSAGLLSDTQLEEGVETIQTTLQAKSTDTTWRVYAGDVPQCLAISTMLDQLVQDREHPSSYQHFQGLSRFFADLRSGSLPNYAFLEPHYFDLLLWRATDEHPPHSLAEGEKLLRAVVGSLAASDYWNESLLVVLYDEHGGFYDKVSPPIGVKAPDPKVSLVPPFDFTRLGLRVPAVLVSPYVGRGVIDATVYDHASVPATLNKLFGLGPDNFLTQRDRFANTFETNLTGVTPRPASELSWATPEVGFVGDALAYLNADLRPVFDVVATQLGGRADELSEHQQALVDLSRTALARLP